VALALCGLPAWRFLTTNDRDERVLLAGLAERAVRAMDTLQRNQAVHVVNALAKATR